MVRTRLEPGRLDCDSDVLTLGHAASKLLEPRPADCKLNPSCALLPHCTSLSTDTSRPKRPDELHERDYYFVSLLTFQADIVAHKFVEHGELEGHFYGTALDSIRRVINSGKYCILNLHCEV